MTGCEPGGTLGCMPTRKPNKKLVTRARIGEELRTARIELKFTPTAKERIEAAAARAKLPTAIWARRVLESAAEVPS